MKGKRLLIIMLCGVLAAAVLCGCLAQRTAYNGKAGSKTETENTQLVTGDGIVYGEVSAVGEETVTIKLGTLETEEAELKLTGGEVAIRTKAETVVKHVRPKNDGNSLNGPDASDRNDGYAMEELEAGDIISVSLDEDGYAETITLMDFPAVSADADEDNG